MEELVKFAKAALKTESITVTIDDKSLELEGTDAKYFANGILFAVNYLS